MALNDNGVELRRLASSSAGNSPTPIHTNASLPPVRSYANLPQPGNADDDTMVCASFITSCMTSFGALQKPSIAMRLKHIRTILVTHRVDNRI